tara:strand:- start:288 stop:566 length:279 start_codon:yes stop_codon:yes gene_type:complete
MRVKGKTDITVDISSKELVSTLKDEVYGKLKLPNSESSSVYVKNDDGVDRWMIEKTAYTSHSFQIEETLGPAEEEDVEVFTAFHTIAEFLRD